MITRAASRSVLPITPSSRASHAPTRFSS